MRKMKEIKYRGKFLQLEAYWLYSTTEIAWVSQPCLNGENDCYVFSVDDNGELQKKPEKGIYEIIVNESKPATQNLYSIRVAGYLYNFPNMFTGYGMNEEEAKTEFLSRNPGHIIVSCELTGKAISKTMYQLPIAKTPGEIAFKEAYNQERVKQELEGVVCITPLQIRSRLPEMSFKEFKLLFDNMHKKHFFSVFEGTVIHKTVVWNE